MPDLVNDHSKKWPETGNQFMNSTLPKIVPQQYKDIGVRIPSKGCCRCKSGSGAYWVYWLLVYAFHGYLELLRDLGHVIDN
ncbi:hypothetical protein COCC4DRAFT_59795 [Bipolaris maydis ATCC 48331]|uniref:Uncharacterized protein n=2 Tax=Cochliobolus heterostrophus TaxID=5016 RepID=M2SM33_COCH5|nr:uncharacterized protein COCC4DRAFT_59795 [Bipolaris maydis ATCC 48331]EMD86370.1 hypothetical protein COCHEDRAFT_1160672 [Bipolaris maydis C5]ENI06320.1 hypothetical protein COCC4DRAFT_59795 [Bipolaris maydis ATCC 48331]